MNKSMQKQRSARVTTRDGTKQELSRTAGRDSARKRAVLSPSVETDVLV